MAKTNRKHKHRATLAALLVMLTLLSLVPAVTASSSVWTTIRPNSDKDYGSTLENSYTDGKAAAGIGVEIINYDEQSDEHLVNLRVVSTANSREGITYYLQGDTFKWYDVSNPTYIAGDDIGCWLHIDYMDVCLYGAEHRLSYSDVWVCSNGFLSFDDIESTNRDPDPIGTNSTPNSLIAGLWRDLDPSAGGSITYGWKLDINPIVFVISWNGVPNKVDGRPQWFQIHIIHTSTAIGYYQNTIRIVYGDVTTKDTSGVTIPTTVGVEDQRGFKGTSYSLPSDQAVVQNKAIKFASNQVCQILSIKTKLTKSDNEASLDIREDTIGGMNVKLGTSGSAYSGPDYVAATSGLLTMFLGPKVIGGISSVPIVGVIFRGFLIVKDVVDWYLTYFVPPDPESTKKTYAYPWESAVWYPVRAQNIEGAEGDLDPSWSLDSALAMKVTWAFKDTDRLTDHKLTATTEVSYYDCNNIQGYTVSTSVDLHVVPANDKPTVQITSPQGGSTLYTSESSVSINVWATATDTWTNIDKVQMRCDGGSWVDASHYTGNSWYTTFSGISAGYPAIQHLFEARAINDVNVYSDLQTISVSFLKDTTNPSVSIVSPGDRETIMTPSYGTYIYIQVSASDPESGITSVKVQVNGGSWVAATYYSGYWYYSPYVASGKPKIPYTIQAMATNGAGFSWTSNPITVYVLKTRDPGPI